MQWDEMLNVTCLPAPADFGAATKCAQPAARNINQHAVEDGVVIRREFLPGGDSGIPLGARGRVLLLEDRELCGIERQHIAATCGGDQRRVTALNIQRCSA